MIKLFSILNEIKLSKPKPFELRKLWSEYDDDWDYILVCKFGFVNLATPIVYHPGYIAVSINKHIHSKDIIDLIHDNANNELNQYTSPSQNYMYIPESSIRYIRNEIKDIPLAFPEDEKYLNDEEY